MYVKEISWPLETQGEGSFDPEKLRVKDELELQLSRDIFYSI
jgi:hypothetical protein